MKKIMTGLLLCLAQGALMAQRTGDITPASLEKVKLENMWQNTGNAAGLATEVFHQYSLVDFGFRYQGGNYRRPQQPADNRVLSFATEGNLRIGKTRAWGFFDYRRDNRHGVLYNASIIDPYRGMPYYSADENASTWENQHYRLGFKVAQPIGKFAIGLEGWYLATLAAKQRDIRTENNQMQLILKPAVVYNFGKGHTVGANFQYFALKEDAAMTNLNHIVDQTYYDLYGLGVAQKKVGSGRSLNYRGNNVGGALQYGLTGHTLRLVAEGGYDYKVEDLDVTRSNPNRDGSVRDHIWRASLQLQKKFKGYTASLTADYKNRKIDGVQYITKYNNEDINHPSWQIHYGAVRSTYKTNHVGLDARLLKNDGLEYRWMGHFSAGYDTEKDCYLMPSAEMRHKNLNLALGGKYNIALSDKLSKRLLLGAEVGLKRGLSGRYLYGCSHPDYPTVTALAAGDMSYFTADHTALQAEATYSQKVKADIKAEAYAKASFTYLKASDSPFSHRSLFEVSVGCNF